MFYADSGCSFVPERKGQITDLIEKMESENKSISALQLNLLEEQFTKSDMFEFFDIDSNRDTNISKTGQYVGGIFFVQNKPAVRRLIAGMIKIMLKNPELIDDTPSKSTLYIRKKLY